MTGTLEVEKILTHDLESEGRLWGDSMLATRIAAVLHRKARGEREAEDDRVLFERGEEMLAEIRQYFETLFEGKAEVLSPRAMFRGYTFFKSVGATSGMEYVEMGKRYHNCLIDCLRGMANPNIEETETFFGAYSSNCSSKLSQHRDEDD